MIKVRQRLLNSKEYH